MGVENVWEWIIKNWEGILAICAIVLTCLEIHWGRRHNLLSVKPHLGTFSYKVQENDVFKFHLVLSNDGLGPAEVVSFSVYFRDKLLAQDDVEEIQEKVRKKIAEHFQAESYVTAFQEGAVIPAKEKFSLLILSVPLSKPEEINNIKNLLDNFDLRIRYRCFYGRNFCLDIERQKDRTNNIKESRIH